MAVKRKAEPVKHKGQIIAAKVEADRLRKDFDGYYDNMCKLLDANQIKIEHLNNDKVIMYDRNGKYSKKQ